MGEGNENEGGRSIFIELSLRVDLRLGEGDWGRKGACGMNQTRKVGEIEREGFGFRFTGRWT